MQVRTKLTEKYLNRLRHDIKALLDGKSLGCTCGPGDKGVKRCGSGCSSWGVGCLMQKCQAQKMYPVPSAGDYLGSLHTLEALFESFDNFDPHPDCICDDCHPLEDDTDRYDTTKIELRLRKLMQEKTLKIKEHMDRQAKKTGLRESGWNTYLQLFRPGSRWNKILVPEEPFYPTPGYRPIPL
jgi:hypothetical protein